MELEVALFAHYQHGMVWYVCRKFNDPELSTPVSLRIDGPWKRKSAAEKSMMLLNEDLTRAHMWAEEGDITQVVEETPPTLTAHPYYHDDYGLVFYVCETVIDSGYKTSKRNRIDGPWMTRGLAEGRIPKLLKDRSIARLNPDDLRASTPHDEDYIPFW